MSLAITSKLITIFSLVGMTAGLPFSSGYAGEKRKSGKGVAKNPRVVIGKSARGGQS